MVHLREQFDIWEVAYIYVLSCRYELDEKFYICQLNMKLWPRNS